MEVEQFYGCYLLYCTNPKYKGHTYIGFTVDPNRRIKQHNKGFKAGGAWRTSRKGPWDMALIVHGFPNEISALRFEWAWQHPERSRRLSHVGKKLRTESRFAYAFRVVSHMLRAVPWVRLPLTIQWLIEDYQLDFQPDLNPPLHMAIAYGPVKAVRAPAVRESVHGALSVPACTVCGELVERRRSLVECPYPECGAVSHLCCLAKIFLKNECNQTIPVSGYCPGCNNWLLWGELVRHNRRNYMKSKAVPQTVGY
ncbi:structure-specific endonuclease subunit slx1 [Dermacentor albipictus]|uniref:structure-specific endonuclease subunit slx1 n=1 Tax=Dermacentor albipictus TaxID=60249 RepID=UPI0038FCA158